MVVFEDENVVYFASIRPEDVLSCTESPEDWNCWDGNEENGQECYDDLTSSEYGWKIIADNEGVYAERMGAAGQEAFSICEE